MDNYNEEFDFDIDYGKRKHSTPMKAIAIVIVILFMASAVFKGLSSYLMNSAADNYKTELKKNVNGSGDKTVYDIEDTFDNEEIAKKAKYVKAEKDNIYYVDLEKAVIIYQDENSQKTKVIKWQTIEVEYLINANNKMISIEDCYNPNEDVGNNLDSCLVEDATYVISKDDKAIIEENLFFNEYYIGEKKQI